MGLVSCPAPRFRAASAARIRGDCMFAMMIHELLVVKRIRLDTLAARTRSAYDAAQEALVATNFEGIQDSLPHGMGKPLPLKEMTPKGDTSENPESREL